MREHIIAQHLFDLRAGIGPVPLPSSPIYLKPSSSSALDQERRYPPLPSIASRKPPARSRFHFRSSTVNPATDRILYAESELEDGMLTILMADKRVLHIHDQPPMVHFYDPNKKNGPNGNNECKHTFDFRVELDNGQRIAIDVKPSKKVESSGIERQQSLIRAQLGAQFADRYLVRTEKVITRDRVFNAKLILRSRRARNNDAVKAALALAVRFNGEVTLGAACNALGLDCHGWLALISLVDDDVLQLVTPCRLTRDAVVRLHPNFERKVA